MPSVVAEEAPPWYHGTAMKRPPLIPDVACFLLAAGSYGLSAAFYLGGAAHDAFDRGLYVLLLSGAAVLAAAETVLEDRRKYWAVLAARAGLTLAALAFSTGQEGAGFPLFAALLVPIAYHNPFPWNAALSASAAGAGILLRLVVMAGGGATGFSLTASALDLAFALCLLASALVLMVRFRERLIDSQAENDRLQDAVDRLTEVNLRYQEYARTVEASSTEEERKRIIYDIHDIVGATLTNIITMTETITDMMQVNPLGVPSLVKAARENAQEGYDRIRHSLYLLRDQEVRYPTGWQGVQRLISVFQRSTRIKVELVVYDRTLRWDGNGPLEEAIYHVIQGSLLNAFRHGRAHRVRILMDREGDAVSLRVRDDGRSIEPPHAAEGIGLAGLRDRVGRLGGTLAAGPVPGGFEVAALLPMETPEARHG